MDKKGFALTETLVVVVFLITIFTFVYVSIIPLLGQYESMSSSESDIDIVYKLNHIRKMVSSDENKNTITANSVSEIKCSSLKNNSFCNKLMEQMELRVGGADNYVLIYVNSMNSSNLNAIKSINSEIGSYAEKHKNEIVNSALLLLDKNNHTMAYLYYDSAN